MYIDPLAAASPDLVTKSDSSREGWRRDKGLNKAWPGCSVLSQCVLTTFCHGIIPSATGGGFIQFPLSQSTFSSHCRKSASLPVGKYRLVSSNVD